MDTLKTIKLRRTTRKFSAKKIDRRYVEEILSYGIQAPSPKNDQPWYFCVVQAQEKKDKIAMILKKDLQKLQMENKKKGMFRKDIESAFETVNILKTASVVIFVFLENNLFSVHDDGVSWNLAAKDVECTHIQSIGAAIQNILLAATDLGIDSIWIGDIFYAYSALTNYLGEERSLMAAVALGYGLDTPDKTPRKDLNDKIKWIV